MLHACMVGLTSLHSKKISLCVLQGNGTELEGIAANTEEELPEDAEDSGGFEEIRSESSLPRSLGTQKKHLEICNKADASYLKSIERMGQKYSKHNGHHIKKFAVGDSVSVRVPRIDRANTDLQRLPCIVVEIVGKACSIYRLCCKEGVLNTCYSAGDLELFNASFEFAAEGWRTMPVVSLREAAKLHAPWNTFTKNKCTCKSGGCNTKRCSCVRNNIECSNHCHHGSKCDNKCNDLQTKKGERTVVVV